MHIAGEWGTKINLHDTEHDVELGFVEPQCPTRLYRISYRDAEQLRDALDTILTNRRKP